MLLKDRFEELPVVFLSPAVLMAFSILVAPESILYLPTAYSDQIFFISHIELIALIRMIIFLPLVSMSKLYFYFEQYMVFCL